MKYTYIICAFTLFISCKNGKTDNANSTANSATAGTPVVAVVDSNNTESKNTNIPNASVQSTTTIAEKDKTYVVDYKAMGAIKLDMPKAEVLKLYPNAKEGTILSEAEIPCLDIMDKDGSLLYKVGIENGKSVSVIISTNKNVKTVSGIGIGSTLAEAKKIYPDIKVSMIEGQWVASAEKRSLSFTVSGSNNDAKVTEIWVN
jgi:hypothetical protein